MNFNDLSVFETNKIRDHQRRFCGGSVVSNGDGPP